MKKGVGATAMKQQDRMVAPVRPKISTTATATARANRSRPEDRQRIGDHGGNAQAERADRQGRRDAGVDAVGSPVSDMAMATLQRRRMGDLNPRRRQTNALSKWANGRPLPFGGPASAWSSMACAAQNMVGCGD